MKWARKLRAWWRRAFWSHKWVKPDRNPYRRVCTVCGRREESYCRTMETWSSAWWESHDNGDVSKHWA